MQMQKIYHETTVADLKVRALKALASSKDRKLVRRALEFGLSKEVRSQDLLYLLREASDNMIGRYELFDFVKANWDKLFEIYSSSLGLLNHCVGLSAICFSSEKMAAEVENFYKDKNRQPYQRRLDQALETVRSNAKWLAKDAADVAKWLSQNV